MNMGKLEIESRKRAKKENYKRAILQTVSDLGAISFATLAPTWTRILRDLGHTNISKYGWRVDRTRDKLVKQGLLKYEGRLLKLTEKGKSELRKIRLANYKLEKPKKWDGKWRVLVFDIPEKRRNTRTKIRTTISLIGFERLQDSVWVYPYDCEDLIILLKSDFKVGKDLLYLIVDSIEYDRHLKEKFKLL